jgi:hypothetical protein
VAPSLSLQAAAGFSLSDFIDDLGRHAKIAGHDIDGVGDLGVCGHDQEGREQAEFDKSKEEAGWPDGRPRGGGFHASGRGAHGGIGAIPGCVAIVVGCLRAHPARLDVQRAGGEALAAIAAEEDELNLHTAGLYPRPAFVPCGECGGSGGGPGGRSADSTTEVAVLEGGPGDARRSIRLAVRRTGGLGALTDAQRRFPRDAALVKVLAELSAWEK